MLEILTTGIGTLLGLGKKYLENKSKKEEFEKELKIKEVEARLEADRLGILHNQNMQLESIKHLADTLKSAHKHDTDIKVEGTRLSQTLNFLRGSVRPILAYAYSLFFAFVTVYFIFKFIQWYNLKPTEISDYAVLKDFYEVILSPWFKATLSTILGFWFGQR